MMARLPAVLAALAGLSIGYGLVLTAERQSLDAGPVGWTVEHPDIPVRLARLSGPPRLPGDGWSLDSHGVLSRDAATPATGLALSVLAELPPGAQIELRLGQGQGAALVATRLGEGTVRLVQLDAERVAAVGPVASRAPLSCQGDLSLPPERTVALGLQVEPGGVLASVGEQRVHCTASVAGQRVALRSGLVGVGLKEISAAGLVQRAPGPRTAWRLLAGCLGALAGLGLVGLCPRFGLRSSVVALALLPALLAGPLSAADLDAALQALRIAADHPLWWGLGLSLGLSGALVCAVGLVSWVRRDTHPPRGLVLAAGASLALPAVLGFGLPGLTMLVVGPLLAWLLDRAMTWLAPRAAPARGASGVLVCATLAGLLAVTLDPRWDAAVGFSAAGGLLLGILLWANARAADVRVFNLLSLACVVGIVASAEQALTWTQTGSSLVGVSSRAKVALDPVHAGHAAGSTWSSFEALENTRQFSDYPVQDYPVRPPARTAPVRLIALGSSSTAGAFQNDDISEFWPADLDTLLGPGVQVVNQGVGGWTSLHVRRYVETQAALLDADIFVIYLGHNDLLSESPRPYRELYRAWRSGHSGATRISTALSSVRLYQLLRLGVQAVLKDSGSAAVPPSDAHDNLAAVIDVARQSGARTLLVTEAVAPDPSVMAPYTRVLQDLAQAPDVATFDAGPLLIDPMVGGTFLDDCHLTRRGHVILARAVADALAAQGWVELPAGERAALPDIKRARPPAPPPAPRPLMPR